MADNEQKVVDTEQAEQSTKAQTGSDTSPLAKAIILVIIMIIVAGNAFFIAKKVLFPKYQEYKIAQPVESVEETESKIPEMGQIMTIGNLTVNTLDPGGRRYVIAEVALEVSDQELIDELVQREPQIRDEFIRYLRRQSTQNIIDPGFQERSRQDLTKMLNEHLNSGPVDSLYYVKLLLQ